MVQQNASGVKTVMSESIRLTKISIQLWMCGQINKDEMEAYQKRITAQLIHFWWTPEAEKAYIEIETDMSGHEANHD